MLFSLGFLSMFLIGGLTGIMLAIAPFDFQLTDSYFVVGHFHWVLIGGTLFGVVRRHPLLVSQGRRAGCYSERLARWQFWLLYVGFILTFGPMHISGMLGMPRRIYTYAGGARLGDLEPADDARGVHPGAELRDLRLEPARIAQERHRRPATTRGTPGRWNGRRPRRRPPYNFETIPDGPQPPAAVGPQASGRSRLEVRMTVGSISGCWSEYRLRAEDMKMSQAAGISGSSHHATLAPAKVGMLTFLLSEVAFFGTLIMAYVYFLNQTTQGDPKPSQVFRLPMVLAATVCLLASSLTIHLAEQALGRGSHRRFLSWWGLTIVLGVLFLVGTGIEWSELIGKRGLTMSRNLFGTTYFTLVGFHALHVTIGVIVMILVFDLARRRQISEQNQTGVEVVSWYWHFVDAVWVVVFTLVYVVGR